MSLHFYLKDAVDAAKVVGFTSTAWYINAKELINDTLSILTMLAALVYAVYKVIEIRRRLRKEE